MDRLSEAYLDKFTTGMWMTYEEFWNDFIKNNDCYSPFQHEDAENGVYIIGKYFHS